MPSDSGVPTFDYRYLSCRRRRILMIVAQYPHQTFSSARHVHRLKLFNIDVINKVVQRVCPFEKMEVEALAGWIFGSFIVVTGLILWALARRFPGD